MKGGGARGLIAGVVALALVAAAIVVGMASQRDKEKECDEWSDRYVAAVDAAVEDGSIQALATGEDPPPAAQEVLDLAEEKPEACTPPQTQIPFPQNPQGG
ncbi:MAG TPA: hypothetical protein VG318_16485 [Actinomycetota bacterium]|nr:hypothetical protein [Actinomycetota bacterium]